MMRNLSILILIVSLVGCFLSTVGCSKETTYKEQLPDWDYKLKLVKSFNQGTKLYISSTNTCYLKYRQYSVGSISMVNCEDFGVINEKPSTM